MQKKHDDKPKKKRLPKISALVQKLQSLVNLTARIRDAYFEDGKWWVTCISCGHRIPFEQSQGGHYFARGQYPAVRFAMWNVNAQCCHCNRHLHGNLIPYTLRMQDKYGKRYYQFIKEAAQPAPKWNRERLTDMIYCQEEQLASLLREKRISGYVSDVSRELIRDVA